MSFWILLGLLCLLSVLAIVWPLVRPRPATGLDTAESRLAVTRDRRLEIDREEQAGRLTAAEASEARDELVEGLARELPGDAPGHSVRPDSRRLLTAAAVVILMPSLAFFAYQEIGEPVLGVNPSLAEVDPQRPVTEQEVRDMVVTLTRHTGENPEDAQAWTALAQARAALGDFSGAADAFAKASALLPDNARLLADQAEMIAIGQDRVFAGRPAELLRQALAVDPGELKANALMSAVYMQAGEKQKALPHLRIVLAAMDPASAEGQQIGQIVQGIVAENGSGAEAAPPTGATAASTASISGSVELAGAPVPKGTVLFISARAPSGPRMPYAALRVPDPTLPLRFELSDANAMSPQRLLSTAGEVVIEARLSQSGNAMRQSGDRFGTSAPVAIDSKAIVISIDQTVP